MKTKFGNDLTVGSTPRHLLALAVPIMLANILTAGYSIINTIWVGRVVGGAAVGAVAVTFPISFILTGLATGATMATSILVSRYYGAKNDEMVEKIINNSITISLFLSLLVTAIMIFSCEYILRWMNTPAGVFKIASSYLKINLAGYILIYLYLLITAILRGIGDVITPLVFLVISTVLNAILDPLLIIGIAPFPKLGLNGAAIASLIAQGIALLLGIIYLNRKKHLISFSYQKLVFQKDIAAEIFKIGFPSMVQQTLTSIGSAFMTSFINFYGTAAIAAFGIGNRIETVITIVTSAVGSAVLTFTAQNLGANQPERVKAVFKWGLIMNSIFTILFTIMVVGIPEAVLSIFVNDHQVIKIGVGYLRIVGAAYICFGIAPVANGVVNGAGKTLISMIFFLASLWAVRIPVAAILSKTSLGITGIWWALVISFAVGITCNLIYYGSGRWRNSSQTPPVGVKA